MKKLKFTLTTILVVAALWITAQEIRVGPNTSITVGPGSTLDISDGDLVLESNASGDASLIDYGNLTYSGGGQAFVHRYITEGKWHLFSSPVSSATSAMFLDDYLQSHAEASNGWTDISSESYNLGIMQGYGLWSIEAAPTTEVFSGTTNTGTLNKSFDQAGLGWNLLGNPYPSSIDWDAVVLPVELNGAFWLFDPTIGANGDYVYYINGGGAANTTSQYIPSGQGFFVRATGGPGNLAFDNSIRTHSSQAFYKESEDVGKVLVLKSNGNNITTQTAIRFNENSTQKVDRLFDVYKIIPDSPDVPVLFTKSESENMAINTLPAIEGNEIVPLYFKAGMNGEYTISASEIETFDNNTPIYLVDSEGGFIQNLRENGSYSFDYESGDDKSFFIYFTEPNENSLNSNINIYAFDNLLNVNFAPSNLSYSNFSAKIWVFDVTGKTILKTQTSDIVNQLPLNVKSNIYMVKVISNSETTTAKVFVK